MTDRPQPARPDKPGRGQDYTKTVHLPQTRFPMKGELPRREPEILRFWEEGGVYRRMLDRAKDRPAFTLHDGPPYANGRIHIGHALNKILKDMAVKTRAMAGYKAEYVPGWDCHGLPIETALLKEMGMDKRGVGDVPAFRKKAAEFAQRFIGIQREEFRRLGALGDWERPYATMEPAYEGRVLQAFRKLFTKDYIYRGLKSVGWCAHCETALAEAEVEYKDKKSPSVYVALPVRHPPKLAGMNAEVLVWTTTPWTLPANMAVAFHPDLEYVLVDVRLPAQSKPRKLLMAKSRLEPVLDALGATEHKVLGSWKGAELAPKDPGDRGRVRFAYQTPFGGREGVGVLADYVSAQDGTGIVHTAPGHGADDFETGRKYGLEIFSPVDASGRYTEQVAEFQGAGVLKDANGRVVEQLKTRGLLLGAGEITHSYPHCWRCKNPIIFRATEQWFLNVSHEGLRDRLLKAIAEVRWIPEGGKSRIAGMVLSRPDWCLSRQRVWGTPIPVLYCAKCGEFLKDDAVLEAIEKRAGREGADFWFEEPKKTVLLCTQSSERAKRLFAEEFESLVWDFMQREVECPKCRHATFRREKDILDVWVDSGASWLAVLEPRGQSPCDLYLEGSDQHRGWFQSSLVLAVALTGGAPYRTVLTHGFVLDEQGRAMHKSLGNVVSPQEVIGKLGADVLRLWAALADYSDDVRLSNKLLEVPTEAYRKIRNTLRYLLGNTSDFDPDRHGLPRQSMPDMDRYLLHRLGEVVAEVRAAYEGFRFRAAAKSLNDFCILDLSSFYLDACKDRLYTLASGAPERRAAQTVLFRCLEALLKLSAPILSFTAEEAWQELRRALGELGSKHADEIPESVFLADFPEPDPAWSDPSLAERWKAVLEVRVRVNKAIEEARAKGALGGSLQAKVRISGDGGWREVLERYRDQWPEILLVSQAEVLPGTGDIRIEVDRADGSKCARCWRWQADVGSDKARPELCSRCVRQLGA